MNKGIVIGDILDAMNRRNNAELTAKAERILNLEMREIAREVSIADLRAKTTISLDSDDYDDGMQLPSDLLGIDMVWDEDDNEIVERNRADIDAAEFGYRFYRYPVDDDPMFFGTDLTVTNEGTGFTSAKLDTWLAAVTTRSVIGEYVRFGEELPYFLISTDTSPYTFTPTYYGPTMRGGDFVVRPPETKKIVVFDPDESEVDDRDIYVYYWKAPRGLYRDSDRIPLPTMDPLVLRVLRRMPEAKDKRPVSLGEIERSMAKLRRMNPNFPRPPTAKDVHNKVITGATSPFGKR